MAGNIPQVRLTKEDSGGPHYLQWRGHVTDAGSEEFSQHNRQTAQQMILTKYPTMILDGKPYSIRVELEESFEDDTADNKSWALQCILQAVTDSTGNI